MNTLLRCFGALLLLLSAFPSFAQNMAEDEGVLSKKEYSRLLGFGVGATYQTFMDEVLSDMRYDKIGATAGITNSKTSETKYTELAFQGSLLNMSRKSEELVKAKIKSFKATMDYRHMYKLSLLNEGIYDVRAGALFSMLFCNRNAPHLGNTGKVYEYAISLGLTAKIARQQQFSGRQGYIIWDVSLPFVSNISRPSYLNQSTSLDPESTLAKDIFGNSTFTSFGKMFRFNSRIHVLYPIKNGNKLRFTYQWDYYKMKSNSGDRVFSAEHTLMLSFLFNY